MSIRHIIVEGPDGGGKTTLINQLRHEHFPNRFAMHPRASDSIMGPVPLLANWVTDDLAMLDKPETPPSIYDRHPIISEPIYGPICRGTVPDMFRKGWWVNLMMEDLAQRAILVLCMPPFQTVRRNVAKPGSQMAGVADNIAHIYDMYERIHLRWPGLVMTYDHTRSSSRRSIAALGVIANG